MNKLWYKSSANAWEQALPVGNGRLGAMVYGGEYTDKIQINEDTLWSGCPSDEVNADAKNHIARVRELISEGRYDEAQAICDEKMLHKEGKSYSAYGTLFVQLNENFSNGLKRSDTMLFGKTDKSKYYRELDLDTAVAKEVFEVGGITYTKEIFTTHADDVLAMNITASEKGSISLTAYLACDLMHTARLINKNTIEVTGKCPTYAHRSMAGEKEGFVRYEDGKESIEFYSMLYAECTDGFVQANGGSITVKEATSVTIYFTIATSYNGFDKLPLTEGRDCKKICETILENAKGYTFDQLKTRHIADYQNLYRRMEFELGDYVDLSTDERIERVRNGYKDANLFSLLFNYGRYLLISGSRRGTQPLNLQGIWNREVLAMWKSNYTLNINAPMNYWHAEACGLSECIEPLFVMIDELAISGKKTAKEQFGVSEGWCACHNTDLWRKTSPVDYSSRWALWPMGGAWLCRHIWEHYLYTNDAEFIKEKFDTVKGAVLFLLGWLTEDNEGYLTTSPSTSPENAFLFNGKEISVCSGSAMDLQIIKEIFTYTVKMCDIKTGEDELKSRLENALARLRPLKIGSDGRLLEWNEEFDESEKGHRHLSHLYGIYPSDTVTEESPYYEAARKSLEYRLVNGGGHTGWSCAWIINLFARFKNSDKVEEYLNVMITHSTYPNMFDAHPPFQIDGNFGVTAGIAEAIVQSHNGKIELLPAIPKSWTKGRVKGLKIRGNKTLDISWENGEITESNIY